MQPQISNSLALINRASPINWAHPLNRGRVAWWLNAPGYFGGSVWRDLAGRNPGTLTNMSGAAAATNGFRGTNRTGGFGSMLFDGAGGYVNAGVSPALNATGFSGISFGGWVYPKVSNVFQGILQRSSAANSRTYAMFLNSAGVTQVYVALNGVSTFGASGVGVTLSTSWVVNAWNHLYLTYDLSNVRIHLNGIVVATHAATGALTELSGSVTSLGYDQLSANFGLNGFEDDICVYNRALSPTEVQAKYNLSRQGYPGVLNRFGWEYGRASTSRIIVPRQFYNMRSA